MRKIFLFLIISVLLIVGGIKAALWYSVKTKADKVVRAAAPFATIQYQKVHTAYDGSLGLDAITISTSTGDMNIGSIRMKAENLMKLLELRNQLDAGNFPKSLRLEFNDVEIDYSRLINSFYQKNKKSPFSRLDALACGDLKYFTPSDLQAMGYDKLRGGFVVSYRFDPAKGVIVDYQVKVKDKMDLNLQFTIKGITSQSLQEIQMGHPSVSHIQLKMEDKNYRSKVNAYCAKLNASTEEQYVAKHVAGVKALLEVNGLYIGDGLLNAYKTFQSDGGVVEMEIDLTSRTPLSQWHLYKADVILEHFLKFKLALNGKAIDDLSLSWDQERVIAALKGEVHEVEEEPEEVIPMTVPVEYHQASFAELKKYRSHKARIETKKGKEYYGKIMKADNNVVELRVKLRNGSISYHIRKRNIAEIEILY